MIRRSITRSITIDPDTFVYSLYEHILRRKPAAEEVASHVSALRTGKVGPAEIVGRFIESTEFANLPPLPEATFINSNAQYGEVALLLREWADSAVTSRVVVDVGARGRERSNSWDLMRHFGWRGLLVEANPLLLPCIRQEFEGLDYTLVGVAVSDYAGTAELTIGSNDDVSSLDPAAAGSWGATRGTVRVEVCRLPDLLAEHGVNTRFGLLSLDIEGEDVKVLVDLITRSDYRPDYIIIEASQDFQVTSLDDLDVPPLLRDTYEVFAQTRANLLLRHRSRKLNKDVCALLP